tara:strand:+ start:472 stop:1677 length:1206 start_codon:yes stop_codon:yes gene_type:complete
MTKMPAEADDGGYAAQEKFLRKAGPAKDIAEALSPVNLSIDDLVYENSRTVKWAGNKPAGLADVLEVGKEVPIVSFFTGCGGMDLGFEAAGFSHVAAFEFNEIFCKTLRLNRPDWKIFGPPFHSGDVSKHTEIVEALAPLITAPFEGVFVGGPPCQPFSIAANQRFSKSGENFKRVGFDHEKNGNLLFDFVNLIVEFRPAAFVIENVPGLRDLDGGKQLSIAIKMLEKAGYTVAEPNVYDAADYGVPQYRHRMFVVGSRLQGNFSMPAKTAHVGSGSVLSVLPPSNAFNHDTRNHKVESITRYMRLNYGQRDQLGRVDRLDPTRPSKTVIAGGTNGGGRSHLHPEIPRTLSVRECARLQTFPDNYKFVGPTARQFTQVGNAVPPVLGAALAIQVAKAYFSR